MRFFLGTHLPAWLGSLRVPLFVSHRRLARMRRLPVAATRWALDSGGFSELSLYGAWQTTPAAYARAIVRYRDEIGALVWAAPQDWMCEPPILAKTGVASATTRRPPSPASSSSALSSARWWCRCCRAGTSVTTWPAASVTATPALT